MQIPDTCDSAYELLSSLVIRDPKQAGILIGCILDGQVGYVDALLTRLALPGEGRLRHAVANAVRTRPDRGQLAEFLNRWLQSETDEFARRSIVAALRGTSVRTPARVAQLQPEDPALVEGYRHAIGRLAHKVRNALEGPQAQLLRLRHIINSDARVTTRNEILQLIARLQDDFDKVGRIVEFDPSDEWFKIRPVVLGDWLRNMNVAYARQFRPVRLQFRPSGVLDRVVVRASDRLLDAIFWNIWTNAQRVAPDDCQITICAERNLQRIVLTILDNGLGFEMLAAEVVLRERFSTHSGNHGTGLLEAQAAVADLHGTVVIATMPSGDRRLVITFPIEGP